jgi:hypothetical protein
VIRNTNPQLKTTTIKTWRDWFADDMGKFNWSPPYTHHMRFALPDKSVVEAEIIFGIHMKNYPKEHFNVREADKLIESIGPEVAQQLIQRGVDTHSVE